MLVTHEVGRSRILYLLFLLLTVAASPLSSRADSAPATAFQSPILSADLNPATFTQWVDGAETPVEVKDGPRHSMWTKDSQVEWDGTKFGESKTPGVRHLRIGFN